VQKVLVWSRGFENFKDFEIFGGVAAVATRICDSVEELQDLWCLLAWLKGALNECCFHRDVGPTDGTWASPSHQSAIPICENSTFNTWDRMLILVILGRKREVEVMIWALSFFRYSGHGTLVFLAARESEQYPDKVTTYKSRTFLCYQWAWLVPRWSCCLTSLHRKPFSIL